MGKKNFKFSGHQTFAFRYGWLEKGVHCVKERPCIFSEEDAIVDLGVGKNMVESIRHWCLLARLIEPIPGSSAKRGGVFQPTLLAHRLFFGDSDSGSPAWDPHMEDDGTLWLIHWLIVSNPNVRTTWWLAFFEYHRPDFTRGEMIRFLVGAAERNGIRVKETVLARDVDCFLHTYIEHIHRGRRAVAPEDGFACPLQELHVIHTLPDEEFFRFDIGSKPTLPASVFAFALGEFIRQYHAGRKTISLQECLYGVGSPGQAFKLDENSLVDLLEQVQELTDGSIGLDETAGLKQLYVLGEFDGMEVLDRYYQNQGSTM